MSYTKKMRSVILIFLSVFTFNPLFSQTMNTVGLIKNDLDKQAYNLFFPFSNPDVYLINNCGQIVNKWVDDSNITPGVASYLTKSGNLVVAKANRLNPNNTFRGGGAGEFIEVRDWNNKLKYKYELNNDKARFHHDIKPMPNGNILAIAWEYISKEDAILNGRDHKLITENSLWPDYILEIDPKLDKVVWEWHAWDHIVQDFDSTKANYGNILENPDRLDLNYIFASGQADWMHSNALDYNEELDIIALSVSHFEEIWFIDHSTSTAEAKSNKGGKFKQGGRLIYRWGNPLAFKAGKIEDKKLGFQHDVRFIKNGQFKGSLSVFNNRFNKDFSSFSIFKPDLDTTNNTFRKNQNKFLPFDFDKNLFHPLKETEIRSTGLSNFQVLDDGNYFVFSGNQGKAIEFNKKGELLWEYVLPFFAGKPISQGTIPLSNLAFKMEKYSSNYEGLMGKNLSPNGYIELEPKPINCNTSSLEELIKNENKIIESIDGNNIKINEYYNNSLYSIYSLTGRLIQKGTVEGNEELNNNLLPGMYIIKTNKNITIEKFLIY